MQEVFIEVSKAVFAICDSESMYIYNLMEYVHSRKGEEFEVQAFTGVESLCACAKEKTIEILLISGKLLCEQVRELQIRKVFPKESRSANCRNIPQFINISRRTV